MGDRNGHVEYRVLWILRAHMNGLLGMRNGLFRTTVQCERHRQITMRNGKIWIEVECALKFFHGFIGAPSGKGQVAEREMCPRIAVVEFGRSFGKRCCLLSECFFSFPASKLR